MRRATRTVLAILPPMLQRLTRSAYRAWPRSRHKGFKANFRKPVPLWSLLFILLLGSASGIAAYSGLIQIAAESQSQNPPDFTIAAALVSQSTPQGQLATFNLDLAQSRGLCRKRNADCLIVSQRAELVHRPQPGNSLAVHRPSNL